MFMVCFPKVSFEYLMNNFQNAQRDSVKEKKNCAPALFLLFTEPRAVTETGVISQDTYFSDICQVVGENVCMLFQNCLQHL